MKNAEQPSNNPTHFKEYVRTGYEDHVPEEVQELDHFNGPYVAPEDTDYNRDLTVSPEDVETARQEAVKRHSS